MVGAGVVGLLTAWRLRLAGSRVTIFDPAPVTEASYAAAGMLAPISEVQYGQNTLWQIMTTAQNEYPALIETLHQATEEPTGYRENGTLQVAADASDRQAGAELAKVQTAAGMTVEPLTSSALRRREPSLAPALAKAWEVPSDHQVDPRALAASATAALNAELSADHPFAGPPAHWVDRQVTRVDRSHGAPGDSAGVVITTDDDHQHTFDQAALVPGLGYSTIEGIPQQHPLPLRPVHGDVLRLRVRSGQLMPGETHLLRATVRAKVAGRSVYLVPREDGGLVIGASAREDGLSGVHAGSVAELLEDAITVLPAVRDMELVEITSRARPGTPDDKPFLGLLRAEGETAGGVVVSTGYHRHGILLAPLAARLTAALLGEGQLSSADQEILTELAPGRGENAARLQ